MTQRKIAFVCVQNAGRSQMATALANRDSARRNMNVRVLTGGTQPAEEVHPKVVEVMKELGIDLAHRRPRAIHPEELESCDVVITMGCSAEDICPVHFGGQNRDWGLDDPDGKDLETVRAIRDEIQRRVSLLFDELEYEYRDE